MPPSLLLALAQTLGLTCGSDHTAPPVAPPRRRNSLARSQSSGSPISPGSVSNPPTPIASPSGPAHCVLNPPTPIASSQDVAQLDFPKGILNLYGNADVPKKHRNTTSSSGFLGPGGPSQSDRTRCNIQSVNQSHGLLQLPSACFPCDMRMHLLCSLIYKPTRCEAPKMWEWKFRRTQVIQAPAEKVFCTCSSDTAAPCCVSRRTCPRGACCPLICGHLTPAIPLLCRLRHNILAF